MKLRKSNVKSTNGINEIIKTNNAIVEELDKSVQEHNKAVKKLFKTVASIKC